MKSAILSIAVLLATDFASATCPVPPANTPSAAAKQLAVGKLNQFMKCDANDPLNDQSPCNTFASRGLDAIYGVKDFMTGTTSHQSANQMWATVNSNQSRWVRLGSVLDEQNNLCAQSIANAGWPVIALLQAPAHGHVALIIPGEPKKSGSWAMLAANSASFFLGKPASAYIDMPLSSAFSTSSAQKAAFFYRKP